MPGIAPMRAARYSPSANYEPVIAPPMRPRWVKPKPALYFSPRPNARSMPTCAAQINAIWMRSNDGSRKPSARADERPERQVEGVVGDGAEARAAHIAEQADIRHQDQTGEQPPRAAHAVVGVDCGHREGEAFEAQQDARHAFDGTSEA